METEKKKSKATPLSPVVRGIGAAGGLILVFLLLRHTGFQNVLNTLSRAAPFFPIVLMLEAAVLACTMCSLRLLYHEDRYKIPVSALVRAGLVGYSVMGLVPAGRTAAESARAALLAKYSSGSRAAVAAARMQGVALLANAAISIPAVIAIYFAIGLSMPMVFILGNCLVASVLGLGILVLGQRSGVGEWLGRKLPRIHHFGKEFDEYFAGHPLIPWRSFLWEFSGRVIQVTQNGILVLAVGGKLGVLPALCSEALHLVGAAAGDLIPGQLGATEMGFKISAHALNLTPADALSIALLAHLAQVVWVVVGLIASVFKEPKSLPLAPHFLVE